MSTGRIKRTMRRLGPSIKFYFRYMFRLQLVFILTLLSYLFGFALIPPDTNPADLSVGFPTTIQFASDQPGVSVEITHAELSKSLLLISANVTNPNTATTSIYVEIAGITPNEKTPRDSYGGNWSIGDGAIGKVFKVKQGSNFIATDVEFQDCSCYNGGEPYLIATPLQVDSESSDLYEMITQYPGTAKQLLAERPYLYQERPAPPGYDPHEQYKVAVGPIDSNTVTPPWFATRSSFSTASATPASPDSVSVEGYTWNKKSGASVTVLDSSWKDLSERHLFISGILFGLAGAGTIALVPEFYTFLDERRKRRDEERKRALGRRGQVDDDPDNESARAVSEGEGESARTNDQASSLVIVNRHWTPGQIEE